MINRSTITLRDTDDFWEVTREEEIYVITGPVIERFAGQTNFDQYQGVARLRDILVKRGIARELERQGIRHGDKIRIGKSELTW